MMKKRRLAFLPDKGLFLTIILTVLAAHFTYFLFAKVTPQNPPKRNIPRIPPVSLTKTPSVSLNFELNHLENDSVMLILNDPSLLSLSSPFSFTSEKKRAPIELTPSVPPELTPGFTDQNNMATPFLKSPDQPEIAVDALIDRYLHDSPPDSERGPESTPKPIPSQEVMITLTDDLKAFQALGVPLLKTPQTQSALNPSIFKVGITPEGEVRFLLLEKTSGSTDADLSASTSLKSWRLKAVTDSRNILWGKIVVHWTFYSPDNKNPEKKLN